MEVQLDALAKLEEFEARISQLEKVIFKKEKKEEPKVPLGWVTSTYFEDNWGFFRACHLTDLLKHNGSYFKGYYIRKGNRFYVDPLFIMRYVIKRSKEKGCRFKTDIKFQLKTNNSFRELYFKALNDLPEDFGVVE